MGKINSKKDKDKKKEFTIIKNKISYKIKLILVHDDIVEIIKIEISFKLNNSYQKYEIYIDQKSEIGGIYNYGQFYHKLVNQIKNKKFEVIHKNCKGQFILLKLNIYDESKMLKLFPTISTDKIFNQQNKINNNTNIINKDNTFGDRLDNDNNNNNLINYDINNIKGQEQFIILNTTSEI